MGDKYTEIKQKRKVLTIFLIIILIIIIILCALYFGTMSFLDGRLGNEQIEAITNDLNELGISVENTNNKMSKYRNIAILGLDSRYDTYDEAYRTDCIMIVRINTENNDVQLYSIYRDTYVEVEDNGQKKLDKINHAYYGGIENTLKAINTNLDLNISEYVMTDFNAVVDIVDAVDGIDIDVDSNELKYINGYIKDVSKVTGNTTQYINKTGLQHLDGIQAVSYCRIRYTEGGDYKRTERMREVLQKVFAKVKNLGLLQANKFLDVLLPKIKTNIALSEIKVLIPKVLSSNIKEEFGWPYTVKEVIINGDYFDPPATLESNVKKLHQEVYGQIDYVVPDNIKEISDKIVKETGVTEE